MDLRELALDSEQRANMTVCELARYIFRKVKEAREEDPGSSIWNSSPFRLQEGAFWFNESELCNRFCQEFNGRHPTPVEDTPFRIKFYEAIALLKRRGLLMNYGQAAGFASLTSVGEKSAFHDGILIVVDDAQDMVNSLKDEAPNLDSVVEQYYLQSLRACQEGLNIASVICLGASSERVVDCLVQAVAEKYSQHGERLEKLRSISAQINYLVDKANFKQIFGFVEDDVFRGEIKDRLSGIAHIYRRNRNEAGHPGPIPMDINRDEQESYLSSFRRYAMTIFKAIDMLNSTP